MMQPLPLDIAVEDDLSEAVLRRLLRHSERPYHVGSCHGTRGAGYLKKNIRGFNKAAAGKPFLVLTDLDLADCAPLLVADWLPDRKHRNLLFRVAVREVESWLLAGRDGFSRFLGISRKEVPQQVEAIQNPKEFLISLARKSRRRHLRQDIVPRSGSTAKVGPDYNGRLVSFVRSEWDIQSACARSDSLRSTFEAIREFNPLWADH